MEMDFLPIYNALLEYWYLIPIFILVGVLQSAWFKGFMGEAKVNRAAKSNLDKKQYHLIKNVTLPTEDGTTQIDHVIVSRFGVFVIETKNMTGWIFGSANQPYWTQQIFKHKSKFQNPLRQNYKHIKALEVALDIELSNIFSLIVFVGDADFKTDMPPNVTHTNGYIRYIKSKQELILSDAQVQLIIQKIEKGRLARSLKTHVRHAKHVKEVAEKRQSNPRCPRCRSPMILREAKKGQNIGKKFWGCSNFPKCRGVLQKAS